MLESLMHTVKDGKYTLRLRPLLAKIELETFALIWIMIQISADNLEWVLYVWLVDPKNCSEVWVVKMLGVDTNSRPHWHQIPRGVNQWSAMASMALCVGIQPHSVPNWVAQWHKLYAMLLLINSPVRPGGSVVSATTGDVEVRGSSPGLANFSYCVS